MKFLYGTDFHGSKKHYEDIFNFAIEHKIFTVHIGSDILPKGPGILEIQKNFVNGYLKEFYQKSHKEGIEVLAFFGNDDIYSRKKYFKKYALLLDEEPYEREGYEFKAYPYVQDYPFGLKTACKLDHEGWVCPDSYINKPVDLSPTGGLQEIENAREYFLKKGTIKEDLDKISATDKTIMAIHQPPWALNLDVCLDGRRVGSKAVYEWIEEKQPKVVLCGHIHESFSKTGVWKGNIGKTLVIQPGQKTDISIFTLIEISKEGEVSAQRIAIP